MTESNKYCQCNACKSGLIHSSDCAVHNEPAIPNGDCDCTPITIEEYEKRTNPSGTKQTN